MVKEKNKGGRPKLEIDFTIVDELCEIQCTGEEISRVIGVNYDTLCRHIKNKFNISFTEYYAQKSAGGKASLRRKQFQAALDGSNVMMIWLGKQYLEQTDKTELGGNLKLDYPKTWAEFIIEATGRMKELREHKKDNNEKNKQNA